MNNVQKHETMWGRIHNETMCKNIKQCGAEYINKPTAYYSQIYETMCKKMCKKHETNLPTGSLEALRNVNEMNLENTYGLQRRGMGQRRQ